MSFNIDDFDKLIPIELSEARKERLKDGLKQFLTVNNNRDKFYTDFYSANSYPYFLQGDLVKQMRFPCFNFETYQYEKLYYDVVLVSNTCDMDNENSRTVKKQVLIAKLIPLSAFIESLANEGVGVTQSTEIITQLKNQQYSNVVYFPSTTATNSEEYITYLDEMSWITNEELTSFRSDLKTNRIATLDFFGYYLFTFKLSFHLCRLPEETHR